MKTHHGATRSLLTLCAAVALTAAAEAGCRSSPQSTRPPGSAAPDAPAPTVPPLDPPLEERRRLIEAIGRQLDAHYVFPEVGVRMAALVRERAAHGDYDAATTGPAFARMVTDHMREVSHDRHAMLEWVSLPSRSTRIDPIEPPVSTPARKSVTTSQPGTFPLTPRPLPKGEGAREAFRALSLRERVG